MNNNERLSKEASLSRKESDSILPVASVQLFWGLSDSEANTQSNKGERILTAIREKNQGKESKEQWMAKVTIEMELTEERVQKILEMIDELEDTLEDMRKISERMERASGALSDET